MVEGGRRRSWPHDGCERIVRSAADWVTSLLDPAQFGARFDPENAIGLPAALSLLNDRFDDVPEQLDARLAKAPDAWCRALAGLSATLTTRRDERKALSDRVAYSRQLDMRGYDRVP
jgi:hypothetical protein